MHYWFKSYGDFGEWMYFAYWWSFIGGGSAINSATPSSLTQHQHIMRLEQKPMHSMKLARIQNSVRILQQNDRMTCSRSELPVPGAGSCLGSRACIEGPALVDEVELGDMEEVG